MKPSLTSKKIVNTLFFVLLHALPNIVFAQLKLVTLDSTQLSKTLTNKEKFVIGYQWKDRNGMNIFYVSRKVKWKDDISKPIVRREKWDSTSNDSSDVTVYSPSKREQLHFKHFIKKRSSIDTVWTKTESTWFCEWSLKLQLLKNSIHLTDLNHDGVAEFWYGIHNNCSSDLSPSLYKLTMNEASRESVRSGRALIVWGGDKWGGETSQDDFKAYPLEVSNYAQQLWEANITEELH